VNYFGREDGRRKTGDRRQEKGSGSAKGCAATGGVWASFLVVLGKGLGYFGGVPASPVATPGRVRLRWGLRRDRQAGRVKSAGPAGRSRRVGICEMIKGTGWRKTVLIGVLVR